MPPWTQYNRHQCLSLYIVHATIKHITKVQQTKTNNNCCFHLFQSQNCGQHQWPHTQSEQPTRTHSNLNACHAIQLISFFKTQQPTNSKQSNKKCFAINTPCSPKTGERNLFTDQIRSTPHIWAYTNATQPSLEPVFHTHNSIIFNPNTSRT